MTMTFPWAPVAERLTARGATTYVAQAEVLGVHRRQVQRWTAAGALSEVVADRVAVALETVPGELWPAEVAELHGAIADAMEAERRAKRAAIKRRYRQRNPDYVARQREARRAAYEHGRAYETARQRRYYAANAERERARVREYERRIRSQREAS